MLGPLQVQVDGQTAVFRTDAERVLLAYLAAYQGRAQRRDTLAGLLSPDRPDQEALTYLRNRLVRLRQALGDDANQPHYLEADRKQIALRAQPAIHIDLIRFEQLLQAISDHHHRRLAGCPSCLARLEEAIGLVRGDFLAGLNFASEVWESWLLAQREHVQQRAMLAMGWLRDVRQAAADWTAVVQIAQQQLRMEPWLEEAHRALMQAYYHLGDRNAALAQFSQCRHILADELGIEPEAQTQQLQQQIVADQLAVPTQAIIPDNLPFQAGPFVGRQAETTQLLERLADPTCRLLTLVGMGGIGKTRLSIEVGRQSKQNFPDGVWFVPLEAVEGKAEQIKLAVGEALGLGHEGKQLTAEQVLAILRDKQLLLLFDNCEVVQEGLAFIPEWLRRAPKITILATSREPLNFQAESVIGLDGLPWQQGETSAAVALFGQRAQMARDAFALSAETVPQVQQICQMVDGSPLGIALAAAWVRRRSLSQIIRSVGDSLDFLSSGSRDADPRHYSMRAVLETSWQLLATEEQQLLAALSVFPTSFTAVAATAVAGATVAQLDLLCEKSLLGQQQEAERYQMHSLVRQFAADKLGTAVGQIEQAFVGYFHQFVLAHGQQYGQLQPEWANLLAAVTKAHALQAWPTVLALVQLLDEPWFRQIRFNDLDHGLRLALAAATALQDEPAMAQRLLRLGQIRMELNDYVAAEAYLLAAMPHLLRLEDSLGVAQAMYLHGRIKNEQAEDEQALALFEASRQQFAEAEDWLGVAKNLNLIAVCHAKKYRDIATAHRYLTESAALQRPLPISPIYVETLRNLARVNSWTQAYIAAETCLLEASAVSQQLNDVGEYAAVLYERVLLCKLRQQYDDALTFGYDCLAYFTQLGSLRWQALSKTQLGLLHQAKQDMEQALQLLNEGLQIFIELGDPYEQAYSYYYLYQLHAQLGQAHASEMAKEAALKINAQLQDPQLQQRLA